MATVRQSGGDYGTLNAALAAAETTIDIDQAWTADDTTAGTFSASNTTITVSGPAKHPGYYSTVANHYRLVVSGGNALSLSGAKSATITGIAISQTGTGISVTCFSCVPNTSNSVTIIASLFECTTSSTHQDCIHTGLSTSIGTISVRNCVIQGAGRAGIISQNGYASSGSGTININSCTINNCGRAGAGIASRVGGGIVCQVNTGSASGLTINCLNVISVHNNTGSGAGGHSHRDFNDLVFGAGTGIGAFNVSYSIASDTSITTQTDGGAGNLESRTATANNHPGTGDWVVLQQISSSSRNLLLKYSSENDALNMHANASAHGLTIPSTDILGNARPFGANYDCGPFEYQKAQAWPDLWYKLTQSSGDTIVNDGLLGTAFNATRQANDSSNKPTWRPTEVVRSGYYTGAIDFDAWSSGHSSDQCLELAANPIIPGLTRFSIAFWLRNNDVGGDNDGNIFSQAIGSGGTDYIINVKRFSAARDDFRVELRRENGTAVNAQFNNVLAVNNTTWQHIVFTLDFTLAGNETRCYVNGTEDGSSPTGINGDSIGNVAGTKRTLIGALNAGGSDEAEAYHGGLSQVMVFFNYVLNSAEVTAIYNNTFFPAEAMPVSDPPALFRHRSIRYLRVR